MSTITAVCTRWGWINQKAFYRLKTAYDQAVEQRLTHFSIDGQPILVNFAKYLIEFLESEGLVPEKTDQAVPIFEQEQGRA